MMIYKERLRPHKETGLEIPRPGFVPCKSSSRSVFWRKGVLEIVPGGAVVGVRDVLVLELEVVIGGQRHIPFV